NWECPTYQWDNDLWETTSDFDTDQARHGDSLDLAFSHLKINRFRPGNSPIKYSKLKIQNSMKFRSISLPRAHRKCDEFLLVFHSRKIIGPVMWPVSLAERDLPKR